MNMKNKGFTLIELLVVIAIIGILSSVVLASLNTARGKGADSAIKANLANIRAQAEIIYDTIGSYGVGYSATGGTSLACTNSAGNSIVATTTVLQQITAAASASGGTPSTQAACATDTTSGAAAGAWMAAVKLKTDNTQAWCVDSTGASKQVAWSSVDADAISAKCP